MKKLAIIGAGPMASIYAGRARELGIESHCFAWAQGAVARDDVDVFHDISVMDIDAIEAVCRREGIGGVLPTTELTIYPTAAVAHRLGLVANDPEVAARITDKYRNRELVEHVEGLYQPRFALINTAADVAELDISYPVVVKPTAEGGKRGVTVVSSQSELADAFAYAQSEKKDASGVIVEEFLAGGTEYSVESLSYRGEHRIIQVTEKWSSGAPHCVELGHHQPANLSDALRSEVERVLSEALTAIGLRYGCCHTEIKIIDGKIYLIEFNARPGGDHISYPLTELSTGYPYITGMIQIAFDEFELPDTSSFEHNYAGVCFVTEQTKELKQIFDTCEQFDWLYEKHQATDALEQLVHNRGYDTNYFIYFSRDSRPSFLSEVILPPR